MRKLTREEILAVYAAGPEAVVSLVEQFQETLLQLNARVQELERRLGMNSRNSHKPPASEGLARGKAPKSLRQPSGRKPGGQPGSCGHTLRQVATPDAVLTHTPSHCQSCGTSLEGVLPCGSERRQVFDLPPLRLWVTEHQAQRIRCLRCGEQTQGGFPPLVQEPVQYGARILALGVYLQQYQLLPYGRTRELLEDLFGAAPCAATLGQALERASRALEGVEAQIKQAIRGAPVVHFDETGIRAQAHLQWLHVAATERLTYYGVHAKRGCEALDALALLPGLRGCAVHDAYASYLSYAGPHALCNAHLLRELLALEEETREPWPTALILLLLEMKEQVEAARTAGEDALPAERVHALRARYERILAYGAGLHPPPAPTGKKGRRKQSRARNLLDRLERHPEKVLAFLYDVAVPFDNNLAERDLRMAKVQQKISGGFRSTGGAALFCRIRGYISTLRKQGTHVLTALESVFQGHPYVPLLSPG